MSYHSAGVKVLFNTSINTGVLKSMKVGPYQSLKENGALAKSHTNRANIKRGLYSVEQRTHIDRQRTGKNMRRPGH